MPIVAEVTQSLARVGDRASHTGDDDSRRAAGSIYRNLSSHQSSPPRAERRSERLPSHADTST